MLLLLMPHAGMMLMMVMMMVTWVMVMMRVMVRSMMRMADHYISAGQKDRVASGHDDLATHNQEQGDNTGRRVVSMHLFPCYYACSDNVAEQHACCVGYHTTAECNVPGVLQF